ncbi:unnamed protein product, partial [Amoebophrya sp. A120]
AVGNGSESAPPSGAPLDHVLAPVVDEVDQVHHTKISKEGDAPVDHQVEVVEQSRRGPPVEILNPPTGGLGLGSIFGTASRTAENCAQSSCQHNGQDVKIVPSEEEEVQVVAQQDEKSSSIRQDGPARS